MNSNTCPQKENGDSEKLKVEWKQCAKVRESCFFVKNTKCLIAIIIIFFILVL